jgi:hypothetical protein
MNEFYGMAIFGVSAAVTAIVLADAALEVISDAGVEGMVTAVDYIDVPGHEVGRVVEVPLLLAEGKPL